MASAPRQAAFPTAPRAAVGRKIQKVPFVELANGRLQGVASSDSDIERVYCAFVEAGSGAHYSSTNNNRPDAGTAKRLRMLFDEAVAQYGKERVLRYMQMPDPGNPRGPRKVEPAGTVFSRFLNYLRFVERQTAAGPVPEMAWFVSP